MEGWIALHRKILENPIATKPKYAWLWTTLLLLANHQETSFIFNNKKTTIARGQILTGRKKLAEITGISEGTVETILNYLQTQQQIQQQKTNKFRLITIPKYNTYQDIQQHNLQQTDNKLTTKKQQTDTYNNINNVNNVNNVNKDDTILLSKNEFLPDNLSIQPNSQINDILNLFKSVNPSYKTLFANKTERLSTQRLIQEHGFEELKKLIEKLPEIVILPYAPKITTPYQLEKDIGKLKIFIEQQKNINNTPTRGSKLGFIGF